MTGDERLARVLGWVRIGLGISQIAAPRGVARAIGIDENDSSEALLKGMGLGEVATGLGMLSDEQSEKWTWARVGGDAINLSLMGTALQSGTAKRERLIPAAAALMGLTLLDAYCGRRLGQPRDAEDEEASRRGGDISREVETAR